MAFWIIFWIRASSKWNFIYSALFMNINLVFFWQAAITNQKQMAKWGKKTLWFELPQWRHLHLRVCDLNWKWNWPLTSSIMVRPVRRIKCNIWRKIFLFLSTVQLCGWENVLLWILQPAQVCFSLGNAFFSFIFTCVFVHRELMLPWTDPHVNHFALAPKINTTTITVHWVIIVIEILIVNLCVCVFLLFKTELEIV